jgi:hypothetical protein
MKKYFVIVMALFFLASTLSLAVAKPRRTHSRPPYSGPKKGSVQGTRTPPPFLAKVTPNRTPGKFSAPKGHIIVR